MKLRFNTYDIICGVTEIQALIGHRVNQIYDVDSKTYLIRFHGGEQNNKTTLLIESGIRFHTTLYDWPKNVAPSGFTMKLRKHIKNKRLESAKQLGIDRVVDLQFGINEASFHIIIELYDRGNIILTDHESTILSVLRPRYKEEENRFVVREKYPINCIKLESSLPNDEILQNIIDSSDENQSLRKLLMSLIDCGTSVIEHVLKKNNLDNCVFNSVSNEVNNVKCNKPKQKLGHKIEFRLFDSKNDMQALSKALQDASVIMTMGRESISKGYIVQNREEKANMEGKETSHYYQNIEYHPYLFSQCEEKPYKMFDSFMLAVDEFYSTLEAQKIDMKTLQQERDALKKLSNVKNDHSKRLEELTKIQEIDKGKAELITMNQILVENAILAIRSAIANQLSWPDIIELVKAAQSNCDPVANIIKQLKLESNHISVILSDPYDIKMCKKKTNNIRTEEVDLDLGLSAWANARKYYDKQKYAAQKEQKTIDASQKALKSAEKKTQQTLKDVQAISTISKARKVYWFEKFYWFISSENYLVIGGRDAQQNELIVKRYMRPNDIYVHAEIQGASSVIIQNPSAAEVPPKTLLEAGTMAISYSVAWDAKVITTAYWVHSNQVSKTAPTGEYLTTGSFMIRGKKNFLPACPLTMGISIIFKLEENFIDRHRGDRKLREFDEATSQYIERNTSKELLDNIELKAFMETGDDTKIEKYYEPGSDFPDTQIKIQHDTGMITLEKELNETKVTLKIIESPLEEQTTIIPAAQPRKKQQQSVKKKKIDKQVLQKCFTHEPIEETNSKNNNQIKRGHKGKLKKIKNKYSDQDEEERLLRMRILKSAGEKLTNTPNIQSNEKRSDFKSKNTSLDLHFKENIKSSTIDDDGVIEADFEMLESLTGQPFEDDELIFAIPVVAPYQTLQNYKFKVKLTPGTSKRGRAAKIALAMFLKDKHCTGHEKDLLKSIKEDSLSRNVPGKVKLSAPQLQKLRK